MDRNSDFSYFNQLDGMDSGLNDMYKDPMFNPILQYDQAYSYYRYLCMQMDYKIKCKDYEMLCLNFNSAKNNISSSNANPVSKNP